MLTMLQILKSQKKQLIIRFQTGRNLQRILFFNLFDIAFGIEVLIDFNYEKYRDDIDEQLEFLLKL